MSWKKRIIILKTENINVRSLFGGSREAKLLTGDAEAFPAPFPVMPLGSILLTIYFQEPFSLNTHVAKDSLRPQKTNNQTNKTNKQIKYLFYGRKDLLSRVSWSGIFILFFYLFIVYLFTFFTLFFISGSKNDPKNTKLCIRHCLQKNSG